MDRTDLTICQSKSPHLPAKLDVCEVYAVFDDSSDRLISVAFSNVSTTDPAGFFQHTLGSNTAPTCAQVALEPTLECDSFVTLGVDCFNLSDTSTLDPDFDSTGFNSSGEVSGGWYNSAPPNGQGAPDANGRVLIARFSYKQNKTSNGDVCAFTKLAGSDEITEFLLLPFDCSNPGMQGVGGGGAAGESECPGGTTLYVDDTATGADNGTSWTDAYIDLQSALDAAASGDQIWVAEGTYKPSVETEPGDPLSATFQMADCLEIYGGFDGTENTFGERAGLFDDTILNGELPGAGSDCCVEHPEPGCDDMDCESTVCAIFGDCCNVEWDDFFCVHLAEQYCGTLCDTDGIGVYHVVVAYGVDPTAVLDGFTITKGQADGKGLANQGGGMNIFGTPIGSGLPSTPQIANCTFFDNYAINHGGAVNDHGGATLTDCVFRANRAASHGAGLYVHTDIGTTVTNCDFFDNVAKSGVGAATNGRGGGVYIKGGISSKNPTFTNCTFSGNQGNKGGGMYCGNNRAPRLNDCTFDGNTTAHSPGLREGGGMYNDVDSAPTVTDCVFRGNTGAQNGGGMYNTSSDPIVTGCLFIDNVANAGQVQSGGGMYNLGSSPVVKNCIFSGNENWGIYGCGGAMSNDLSSNPQVVNCQFLGNSSSQGGAVYNQEDSEPELINCLFAGNHAGIGFKFGGAIRTIDSLTSLINCAFIGNEAGPTSYASGGAIYGEGVSLINCTFARNVTEGDGGGLSVFDGGLDSSVDNCVFWENEDSGGVDETAQIHVDGTNLLSVTYSDIQDDDPLSVPYGGSANGNIDLDPMFVVGPSGTWSAVDVYDTETGQTTLTDFGASFGDLSGKLLNPDTTQVLYTLIVSSTPDTMTVWGDFSTIAGSGDTYEIIDLNLVSPGSPCIDAADNTVAESCGLDLDGKERFVDDPATLPTGVPTPGGDPDIIADMGAYEFAGLLLTDCNANALDDDCEVFEELVADCNGNDVPDECDIADGTSTDCQDTGVSDDCCPADFNGDEIVDAFDLATLLGSWGGCTGCVVGVPTCACQADVDNDCAVDAFDLASLLGAWGACVP